VDGKGVVGESLVGKELKRKGGEGLINKSLMGKMKEKLNLKDKRKKRRK
jgi:hypothetical protein